MNKEKAKQRELRKEKRLEQRWVSLFLVLGVFLWFWLVFFSFFFIRGLKNRKATLSYLWTFISIVVYVLGFGVVASAWQNSIALGIVAFIFVLVISPVAQTKAVNLAKEQRSINGKGKVALLLAYLLPTAILAMGFFFFVFGGMYSFDI